MTESDHPFRLVIAMTGATGAVYGVRLLEVLRGSTVETHLIVSRWARQTIVQETGRQLSDVLALAHTVYDPADRDAAIVTGAVRMDGMIVAPCSMKSLAAIAHGVYENVIHRAADIAIRDHRRLLLVVRESPLSVIHLENMLTVARAGAFVVPPVPAFYARPRSLEEMIDHTVGRLLDHFGIAHDLARRWGEPAVALVDDASPRREGSA